MRLPCTTKFSKTKPSPTSLTMTPACAMAVSNLLRSVDIAVEKFGSAKEFLDRERPDVPGCLVLDVRLPGMSGLEFQAELGRLGIDIPVVFITGHADVPMGVKAMKAGAIEFLCKPFREQDLLDAVRTAINKDFERRTKQSSLAAIQQHYGTLTPREKEVMAMIVSGMMNKQIAAKAGHSRDYRQGSSRKSYPKDGCEILGRARAPGGCFSSGQSNALTNVQNQNFRQGTLPCLRIDEATSVVGHSRLGRTNSNSPKVEVDRSDRRPSHAASRHTVDRIQNHNVSYQMYVRERLAM